MQMQDEKHSPPVKESLVFRYLLTFPVSLGSGSKERNYQKMRLAEQILRVTKYKVVKPKKSKNKNNRTHSPWSFL